MLGALAKWFKSVLAFIKKHFAVILIIALIVIAIWFPYLLPLIWGVIQSAWAWLVTSAGAVLSFFAGLGLEGAIAAAIGMAILIDPEGAAEAVSKVVRAVGDATGSVLSDILSTPGGTALLLLGGGLLIFTLLPSREKEKSKPTMEDTA